MVRETVLVEPQESDATSKDKLEASTTSDVEAGAPNNRAPELPEKYQGKSVEEIIAMHQNAEKRMGQLRDEVGTWRGLVEDLSTIKRQADLDENSQGTEAQAAPDITADTLLENPAETIASIVKHAIADELQPIRQQQQQSAAQQEFARLKADFPDFEEVAQSEEFQTWGNSRPARLADLQAAGAGDITAARRLLESYAEVQELRTSQGNQSTTTQGSGTSDNTATRGLEAAAKAATESGGNSAQTSGKPVLNGADIVDMMIRNPDKYKSEAFQAEFVEAAKEGRVRF